MAWWFSYVHDGPTFTWLGPAHLSVLVLVSILCLGLTIMRKRIRQSVRIQAMLRYTMVATLIGFEAAYQSWYLVNGVWDISFAMPLHLSSMTWITAVIMLLTGRQRWFEITFFAGVGSAALTLITPDVGGFGFPHFRFFSFLYYAWTCYCCCCLYACCATYAGAITLGFSRLAFF